jgi:NADPH-dependent ferric siderophore reductase
MLGRLPARSYGQVVIEIASAIQIQRIDAPQGMSVTWLRRDADGTARRMAPRGELIVRAVGAWFDEWMFEDSSSHPRMVWIGCGASPRVTRLHRELRSRYPTLSERSPASAASMSHEEEGTG